MRINDVLDLKGHRIETVWPWRSVGDIPRLFVDRNIASVVVIEVPDRPIGIVTDRLLLGALAERGTEILSLTAKDITRGDRIAPALAVPARCGMPSMFAAALQK